MAKKMKRDELVSIALKIASLFIIIILIRDGFQMLSALGYMDDGASMDSLSIAYIVVLFTGAVLLFIFALPVARVMLPSGHNRELEWNLTLEGLETVCFSVLGMYMLVNVVPDTLKLLFIMNVQSQYTNSGAEFSLMQKADVASLTLEFFMGLYLLLGGRGLSRVLNKFRSFGLSK